jgi:hypothetical protein
MHGAAPQPELNIIKCDNARELLPDTLRSTGIPHSEQRRSGALQPL